MGIKRALFLWCDRYLGRRDPWINVSTVGKRQALLYIRNIALRPKLVRGSGERERVRLVIVNVPARGVKAAIGERKRETFINRKQ